MMQNSNDQFVTGAVSSSAQETVRPSGSGCEEWQDILQAYPAAMQHYCQMIMSLISLDAATFNDGWTKAEQARKVCEDYREKLFHHRHEHGCFKTRGL
jgi:hypothetical protein